MASRRDTTGFSARLRVGRLAIGLTQAGLANAAKVSQSLISAIERGERDGTAMSSASLNLVAKELRLDPHRLLTGEDRPTHSNLSQMEIEVIEIMRARPDLRSEIMGYFRGIKAGSKSEPRFEAVTPERPVAKQGRKKTANAF